MSAPDCLTELGATAPDACPYLGGRDASLRFFQPIMPLPADVDQVLACGFRRHGELFYRPDCPAGCPECVPIRVPIGDFTPSRSQRRLRRRHAGNYDVRVESTGSRQEHLELFNRHAVHVSRDAAPLDAEEYTDFLLRSPMKTGLLEYRVEGRLAGVGVLDIGDVSASSIYFFWDPDLAHFEPGTFSALWEIEWCRQHGFKYYYLGYWIRDCRSMSYKVRFRPHELMNWSTGLWHRRLTE